MKIELEKIKPSIKPIRTSLDEEKLDELTQSIKEQGLIVPIKVRPVEGGYEIVYGHRRYEASKRAGLVEIECFVEGINDNNQLVQALIENVVRENMSDYDEGLAYKKLKEVYGVTTTQMVEKVGKSQRWITRCIALANDPLANEIRHLDADTANIAEISRKIDDVQSRKSLLSKVVNEGLNSAQTRKVADAVVNAETPEERKFILETPIENPMFDRIVRAKERAEIERKAEVAERHMENTQEVKQFLDSIKVFEKAIKEVMEVIDFDKFSPEAVQFTLHRLEKLSETINDLTVKLMEAKK